MPTIDGYVVCRRPKSGPIEELGIILEDGSPYAASGQLMVPRDEIVSLVRQLEQEDKCLVTLPLDHEIPVTEPIATDENIVRTKADELLDDNLAALPTGDEYALGRRESMPTLTRLLKSLVAMGQDGA